MRDAAAFKRRTVHRLKLHLVPFGPLVHIARPSGVPARYTEGGNARFPDRMQAWLQFIGLIVTIVGAAVWIVRTLGRLESRIERIELRIGTVEYQNRALLKAFPQLISSLMAGGQVTPQQGSNLIATALDTPFHHRAPESDKAYTEPPSAGGPEPPAELRPEAQTGRVVHTPRGARLPPIGGHRQP